MKDKLDIKDFVLLGRTFSEYEKMFSLTEKILSDKRVLDVASGVCSFCAEANFKGFQVTASDKIYLFKPDEIEEKCSQDLLEVVNKLTDIKHLYNWTYFSGIDALKHEREKAYKRFLQDFKEFGEKRYITTNYPRTNFREKQFDLSLVSHFLFLYDEHLTYEFHKETLNELIRITSGEIRIFPLLNLKGEKSRYLDFVLHDQDFKRYSIEIREVDYEFIKGGNKMMVITGL